MRILSILLSILISQNSFANIALGISKGIPAPYDGVLLDKEKTTEVFNKLIQLDKEIQINLSLQKSLDLMNQNEVIYKSEISELQTQNNKLDDALVKANSNSFWNKAAWFGLGVLTTGAIVYAVRH